VLKGGGTIFDETDVTKQEIGLLLVPQGAGFDGVSNSVKLLKAGL